LSQRPRSICAQRTEQKGRYCGSAGLPQIGQRRDEGFCIDEIVAIVKRIWLQRGNFKPLAVAAPFSFDRDLAGESFFDRAQAAAGVVTGRIRRGWPRALYRAAAALSQTFNSPRRDRPGGSSRFLRQKQRQYPGAS
jgi:hypothetical protein